MTCKQTKQHVATFNGESISAFTIENENGISVTALDYGCTITSIVTPDRHGNYKNIVLEYEDINDYLINKHYLGSVVGRVAGRIEKGIFSIDENEYNVVKNQNGNHLHGGVHGLSKVTWKGKFINDLEGHPGIEFSYTSKDGDEGYPGNVELRVTYILTNQNELKIHYYGVSDKDTLLDLTNHTYFNLTGIAETTVLHHELKMASEKFIPLKENFIPIGEERAVTADGGCYDFRAYKPIKNVLITNSDQVKLVGNGIDHPFLLEGELKEISLKDPQSGRQINCYTDRDAVVIYTGNHLKDQLKIQGKTMINYAGICLETQGVPNAINSKHFSAPIVRKGETYTSTTVFTFSVNRS